jgi:hypothetical protein
MPRARHPKKDVEKALRDLESDGWTITPKASGHRWGKADCGQGCSLSIWSTPKSPQNHANAVRRAGKRCPHNQPDPESSEA